MKKRLVFLFSLAVVLLAACSNNDDEAPNINLISPVDGQSVFVGSSFVFSAAFTDNEDLDGYSVSISGNGLNWTHGSSGDLTGGSQSIETPIAVDPTAEVGEYTMVVRCTDEEGNPRTVEITINVTPS